VNKFQPVFDKQKDYFNTDATKSYEWRIEQLDRMAKMLNENKEAFHEAVSKDFKTALEEKVFEVAAPLATIEFTKNAIKRLDEADLRHCSKCARGLGTHRPSYPGAIRCDADHWSVQRSPHSFA